MQMKKKLKEYIAPEIQIIQLDNHISLNLESEPPVGPNEKVFEIPDMFNMLPFKMRL